MEIPSLSTTTPFDNYNIAANVFSQLPIVGSSSPGTSSPAEQYLALGPDFQVTPSLVDLSDLDNVSFATRLTTVFNTYFKGLKVSPTLRQYIPLRLHD